MPSYPTEASNQFLIQAPFSQSHGPQQAAFIDIRHGVQGHSAYVAGEINNFEPVSGLSLLPEEGEGVSVKMSGRGDLWSSSRPNRTGCAVGGSSDASNPTITASESSATSKTEDNSSTRSISSMAIYWVPEEIKRYFRDCCRNTEGSSLSPPGSCTNCKEKPREREFRRFALARNTLLVVLAVAVIPLLVGMVADVCKALWGSGVDRRPPMSLRKDETQATSGTAGYPAGTVAPVRKSAPSGTKAEDNDPSIQVTGTGEEEMGVSTHSPFLHAPIHEAEERLNEDGRSSPGEEVSPTKPHAQEKMTEDTRYRPGISSANVNNVPEQSPCGAFAFTYCQSPKPEFFYKHAVNACVAAATDHVGLCSRGRNRFASKRNCREECAETKSLPEHCLERAVFEKCGREDVRGDWWHFDGHACRAWNFTSGMCPSYRSDVFSSQQDCLAKCRARTGKLLCRAATPEVCYSDHLRFPYFALADPEALCLRVSDVNHLGRRCLTGPNRFESLAACQKTCVLNSLRV
ncbi:uncharacterized protein LOC144100074 [Amblyomma americanum]